MAASRLIRARWAWRRMVLRVQLWVAGGELDCGCHTADPYGAVIAMGCPRHD